VKNTSLKFIFIPSVLILLIVAGYLACQLLRADFKDLKGQEASPATLKVETGISTSNWKTYKDEEHGYKIDYPGNWALTRHASYVTIAEGSNDQISEGQPSGGEKAIIIIRVLPATYSDISDWLEKSDFMTKAKSERLGHRENAGAWSISDNIPIVVGGIPSIKNIYEDEGGRTTNIFIPLKKDTILVISGLSSPGDDEHFAVLFDQILATFNLLLRI